MGKFESYPEANALGDNDITLYNKNTVTHKITFSRLVSLIKAKIAQTGLVTSISTGAGLVSNTITSSGTIKCKLKSETVSSLSSANPTITANRQYPVGLDREGYLSVNVPWTENSTYSSGTAIDITNGTISVILDNTYSSSSTAKAASAKAVKDTYDNSMRKDGGNADTHVHFSNALTVGTTRKLNSTIGGSSVCFGYGNIASESNSFASGVYTEASGFASHSEGRGTDQPNYTEEAPEEYYSQAIANISANGEGSHAEGLTTYEEQSNITGIIQANGHGSHAEGYAQAGQGDSGIIASGLGSHAEGYADSDNYGASCYIIAKGNGSHAEGMGTRADGKASHAEGQSTTASGDYSHAEGNGTKALYAGCHTEGYQTKTENPYAHAEGYQTTVKGAMAHAEGQESIARGHVSHAEGQFTEAGGSFSHAEGSCGIASGVGSHVEGGVFKGSPKNLVLYQSQNNNTELVKTTDTSFISGKTYYLKPYTITPAVNANPKQNHWLELQSANVYVYSQDLTVDSSKTYYDSDVVFGDANQPSASGYFAHSEGNYTIASGHYSHSEGQSTQATKICSHAEGYNTTASGRYSHAEGHETIASGDYSHAEGAETTASSDCSHAEGADTTANGQGSHAEGIDTTASGQGSHAEGDSTEANKICAHAEGHNTTASGNYSHAEGDNTNASGGYSHAEGQNTKATKACTHAEGYNTQANANYSHAEGYNTKTTGVYSHAEGNGTQATGNCSYAGGYNTVASGNYSHAGGAYAEASLPSQLVQGAYDAKYNDSIAYGYGVFGVSPNAKYYTTPYTIQAQNGHSATVASGVEMTLVLDKYAMYMLYWTTYSGTNDVTISSGMHLISTSAEINNPHVQDILDGNIIDSVDARRIILLDNNKYMYHLIRII